MANMDLEGFNSISSVENSCAHTLYLILGNNEKAKKTSFSPTNNQLFDVFYES